jgi:hypothetical protein
VVLSLAVRVSEAAIYVTDVVVKVFQKARVFQMYTSLDYCWEFRVINLKCVYRLIIAWIMDMLKQHSWCNGISVNLMKQNAGIRISKFPSCIISLSLLMLSIGGGGQAHLRLLGVWEIILDQVFEKLFLICVIQVWLLVILQIDRRTKNFLSCIVRNPES